MPRRLWYEPFMPALSPIESEFASTEEADAYESWFRAKVLTSLADKRPATPHDAMMAETDEIINGTEQDARLT
jgi:hypothetical protein